MQKRFSACLVLSFLMSMSLAARQAAQPWVTYAPPSKNFTALFPATPKADHQTMNDGGPITEVDTYTSIGNGIFFVNYMHLNPKSALTADAALKTAQDGMLQSGGAKLMSSNRTDFLRGADDRLPMLEFTGETDTTAVSGRAILDADHVYTLATLCQKGQNCSAAVTRFFNSFKLTPKK
jgi:hypothetical protein